MKLAMIENAEAVVYAAHPKLASYSCYLSCGLEGCVNICNNLVAGLLRNCSGVPAQDHPTAIAGTIRSVDSTHRGFAPKSLLWWGGECGTQTLTNLSAVSNAAVAWGAAALNLSWGAGNANNKPGVWDEFYDNLVINNARTVVKSAGNAGTGDGLITSPGLGYNMIVVGAHAISGMVGLSSYVNPTTVHGDREKPDIVAFGSSIYSTLANGTIGNTGEGTSGAAGIATGSIGLMISRHSNIALYPAAIKAVLLASAAKNIDGYHVVSDKDGAGAIRPVHADDVVRGVNGGWGSTAYDCTSPYYRDIASFSLTAGVRARVAITWYADPAGVTVHGVDIGGSRDGAGRPTRAARQAWVRYSRT